MWERADTQERTFRCTDCGRTVPMPTGRPREACPCDKTAREDEVVTYTTAPADYDWFGTRTLVGAAGITQRDKAVRKVAGPARYLESQRDRYRSGLHMAVDEAEWRKLVSCELVDPTPAE